ncbi:trypsin-like serine peptidase [Actinophytocola sp. NPDC049390]|uniref:trypsin-like serine peptidase n=1 Tax=Actinophytocola sp. NPDC049390 TaxID=3363894 RepID=UPI003788BE54
MPARTIGTLYYVRDDGTPGYCTATVITAENQSTIWTAGHCVHGGGGRGWFSQFLFEPDHHDGQAPYGEWEWLTAATTQGWMDGDYDYDIGAIALFPNSLGDIANVTGSQGYMFGQGRAWLVTFFGYPQAGVPARPEFTGEQLFYCFGQTDQKSVIDDRMVMDCDMHSGASGGPWIYDLQSSRGWGYIVGAFSGRNSCLCDSEAISAYHGDAAISVYNAVRNV